ncbi:MAG TPA: hypothetical protein VHY56_04595 [Candidatus Binataceae bacterium]|jgi:hypothetical protein|nr:hypothetical protein [Candidatus Binataceae bacterium]
MFGCNAEPGLTDTLADPIVHMIMNADNVDPQMLEVSLRETARKVASTRRQRVANEN